MDDQLASIAAEWGLRCFRGSLVDPLARIVSALEGRSDDALVFRLTADNLLPDGTLLDQMEEYFLAGGHDYLICGGEQSGLPYGVSAELTRLAHLREADASAVSPFEREHVTPYIRGRFEEAVFDRYQSVRMSHHRSTVDCLDDYLRICRLFNLEDDPIGRPFLELIQNLKVLEGGPETDKPCSKFVLGTAQLGMDYGIANRTGMPESAEATALVKTAITNGAVFIDTARAYGRSEEVVGRALGDGWQGRAQLVTKLDPLANCPSDASEDVVCKYVELSVMKSLWNLGARILDFCLLHRADHIVAWDGEVWRHLQNLQEAGLIGALGVSVQTPEELDKCLEVPEVSLIQLPMNLLDHRWEQMIPRLRAGRERGLIVHVRSVFLQGLLLTEDPENWYRAGVEPEAVLDWLRSTLLDTGMDSVAELCVRYACGLDWVDGVVIGVETLPQLQANLRYVSRGGLDVESLSRISGTRPRLPDTALNPSNWLDRRV
jgi:spore coat polysaccharide biosynthesis protein SpsF